MTVHQTPEAHSALTPRALIAAGVAAGTLLLPAACSFSDGSLEHETTTSTTLPEGTIRIDAEPTDSSMYKPVLTVSKDKLGYKDNTIGYPDVQFDQGKPLEKYAVLAEASLDQDGLVMTDKSPAGMDTEILQWFGERLMSRKDLVEEALQSGSIEKVIIGLQNDYMPPKVDNSYGQERARNTGYVNGFYDPDKKAVVLSISTLATQLDPEFVEQYISHETTHSLFADSSVSYFNKLPTNPEVRQTFVDACNGLRQQVTEDTAGKMWLVASYMREVARGQGDVGMKARFSALADQLEEGIWLQSQRIEADPPVEGRQDKVVECAMPRIGQLAKDIADLQGLPQPADNWMDLEQPGAGEKFDDAQTALNDLFKQQTIYRSITESTYNPIQEDMGHPFDNLDELAASTVNLLLSYPKEMAANIAVLPQEEQSQLINLMRLVVDQITVHHSGLSGYLTDAEATLMDELHR